MSDRPDERAHEPKLAALALFDAGRLSDAGGQRLLRHLQRCDTCRDALAGLRRFERLAGHATTAELPALDWSKLEGEALKLGRSAGQRRSFARTIGSAALLAAAAVLVAVLSWSRSPGSPPVAVPVRPASRRAAEPLDVVVTALVGAVQLRWPDGHREALTLDSHPQPGSTIETEAGAEAHLWLANTAQLLVRADSALGFTRLTRDAVELDVERGSAVSKVRPLGGRHYEVTASGYRASVRGTHFEVSAHDASAAVRVDEGHVVVLSASGVPVADLFAPQAWASTAQTQGHADGARLALPIARPPADPSATAVLTVPVLPAVTAWHIGDVVLGASGELRMRVPPGVLDLTAELGDGKLIRTQITIDPLGTRFDPGLLHLPDTPRVAASEPRAPQGALDPGAAAAIIRGAQPALQRCYERSLRTTDLAGIVKLRLRLALDASGKVRSTELRADDPLPQELAECVREATRSLSFPAPGGSGVTFEAPISFRSR